MNQDSIETEFGLNEEEAKLNILACHPNLNTKFSNIVMISPQALPNLQYQDQSFDLALCSDVLFSEKNSFSETFHVESILELLRIAGELRVLPIVNEEGQPSPHLLPILQLLQEIGLGLEIKKLRSDKNCKQALLRIWHGGCKQAGCKI